ncbi:MAG: efflux RND transporter periplasmic adaptor subunit [Alphaproteobacteria bacterium]|nr:efflux RND transporter periplasmic adaptor subunit [Alphaproteobacteria bacterium]MBR1756475.1 efflux RND transporter periplasmic adaptor subunit [Alphaproteobacteria bacterium]
MSIWLKFRYFLIAAGILVYHLVFNILSAGSAVPAQADILELNAIPIDQREVRLEKKFVGYVIPIEQVMMAANAEGYIDDVLVEGGQNVKVGDNLVLIDQRPYQAQLEAAKAAVAQADAEYQNAKSYYKRVRQSGKQAFSALERDNALSRYKSTYAAYQQALANVHKAEIDLNYTVVQAPINGIVGNIFITKGNYITPNTSMFSLVQSDPVRVVFSMPDKDFWRLTRGQENKFSDETIKISLPDGQVYPHNGIFKFYDNVLDKSTNSIAVYADFANPERELIANQYVDVLLQNPPLRASLIRKNYAIIKDSGIFAYIAAPGRLKLVKLEVAGTLGDFYAVTNRFAADEYLITDNITAVPPSAKVKIMVSSKENS